LHRIEAQDGFPVWKKQLPAASYATPVVRNGRVLVGDNDGNLSVYSLEGGDLKARYPAGGAIQSPPGVVSGTLVFGARDEQLHALRMVGTR